MACGKALSAVSVSPLLICSLHCVFPLAVSFHHKCLLNHLTGKLTWRVNSAEQPQSKFSVCLRLQMLLLLIQFLSHCHVYSFFYRVNF